NRATHQTDIAARRESARACSLSFAWRARDETQNFSISEHLARMSRPKLCADRRLRHLLAHAGTGLMHCNKRHAQVAMIYSITSSAERAVLTSRSAPIWLAARLKIKAAPIFRHQSFRPGETHHIPLSGSGPW